MWREALAHFEAERVMWGSDYPHPDSTWPHSGEFIRSRFAGAPQLVLERVLGRNAAQLYGI
jgi:predicted TIM-barrel fold metal-dependent hydrolase